MTRLQTEFVRLYAPDAPSCEGTPDGGPVWVDAQGRTRVMVVESFGSPDWALLSALWQGVQIDWEWPAPAIAVSGRDGLQLWFSVAEPVALSEATAMLAWLRQRYLQEGPRRRVRLWPDGAQPGPLASIPAHMGNGECWSAFVAADLVPLFEETPWLDIEPSEEGQAALLAGLGSIRPASWKAVVAQWPTGAAPGNPVLSTPPSLVTDVPITDPRVFLLQVMNDASIPMAQRIEAAKALLESGSMHAAR